MENSASKMSLIEIGSDSLLQAEAQPLSRGVSPTNRTNSLAKNQYDLGSTRKALLWNLWKFTTRHRITVVNKKGISAPFGVIAAAPYFSQG
jgi:hypothetical protein